jgi:dipeptidyl aminopeptidase/acylaminoacyl peptidase
MTMRLLASYATWIVIAVSAVAPQAAFGQARSVPASIVAEGVPAVPEELARGLARYQNFRAASFEGWLDGRREILITTRFANTNQVHHVAMPLGARTQLTFLEERVLAAMPDRAAPGTFAFSADVGGAENYQLFLDDLNAGVITRLTDGKSRNVPAPWSHSGKMIAYSNNARNGRDMDLYVVAPPDAHNARRFKEVSGDWAVSDWSPDDRRVVVVERVSINESYVHLVDVATGATETLTSRSPTGAATVSYEEVRYSKDGGSLYWVTDRDSEFRRLVRVDLATKAATVLTPTIPWDVESYDLSGDGRQIVLSANEGGLSRLHVLDAATGREQPGPALPPGIVSGLKFRKESHEFGFTHATAQMPGDVYSFDLDGGRLTRWTKSETGGLKSEGLAEPALIEFPTFDGRRIPAVVYRPGPTFTGKRPVIIDIHGGPEGQSRPRFLGRLNYLIDELGITLIFPNVRGSLGYGKTYLELDNGFHREDSVKDIGALLDWVAIQPDLDSSRVAVVGGSYGGYMCLASLTFYSDRLRAGIDRVGISNFVTFLNNTSAYRRDLRRVEYGDERDPKMKKHLLTISPLTKIEKIKVPLLVVAGRNDPRVPASESEQVVSAVKKNGQAVWYVEGKNEGHGFARKENLDYLQAAEVLFLKRFLLGEGP